MKTLNAILKVVTALAAVASAIYIVATYGEEIVAWAKKLWASLPKCPSCEEAMPEVEVVHEEAPVAPVAPEAPEAPAEPEAPVAPEAPAAPQVPANEPVAEDNDFAE